MEKISHFEFESAMHRLEAVLGKKMEPEMVNEYYIILKRYDVTTLNRAITWAIRSMKIRVFPTPGEIATNAKFIAGEKKTADPRPIYCSICDGGGLTIMKIKKPDEKEREVAVRCRCQNAEKYNLRYFPLSIDHFPEPPKPEGLATVDIEEILQEAGKNLSFKGIVRKKCKNEKCGNFYYLTYEKETPVDNIAAAEEGGLGLCEECYVKEGRVRGFWK